MHSRLVPTLQASPAQDGVQGIAWRRAHLKGCAPNQYQRTNVDKARDQGHLPKEFDTPLDLLAAGRRDGREPSETTKDRPPPVRGTPPAPATRA